MNEKSSTKSRVLDPDVKPSWYDNNLCIIGRMQDVLVNFACCCNEVVEDDELVKDISSVLQRVSDAVYKKYPIEADPKRHSL